ncbi:hypothetical protein [Paraferrimonas sedimenticola]|uniref:Uncharacterized protein n=1 Tax=Paraferrimonas sedimenticola TaxID=375674 RepID=A0AA37RWH3_9GAMM|nr:hypothetical protein [Paraferrimonas sedimenticola]GLP96378.1 hypothetical protein GCM10007895_16840 [Paraferrimonas sedimenticola]
MQDNVSLPKAISDKTLAAIVEHFQMEEVLGADGGPYMDLQSHAPIHQGSVGAVRVFKGRGLAQLVTCSIVVPAIFLDSHMIYGFTAGDSLVPHFTLDSVKAGEHCAFHLDLTPKQDLGANYDYLMQVYKPLTDSFNKAQEIEGLTPAQITPLQRSIMSPWMLVHRASEAAYEQVFPIVDEYREYWQKLVDEGIDLPSDPAQVEARDLANRAMIFSPEIDKVWDQITPLIGAEAAAAQLALLQGKVKV